MDKAEEYIKSTTLGKLFRINKRNGIDTKYELKQVLRFAEAYKNDCVNAISKETKKAIDKFGGLQKEYPIMATKDIIQMLERLDKLLKK